MIIFCFLTYDNIITYKYWNKFFENVDESKYEVFIHPKNNINMNLYKFKINKVKNIIPTVNKTHISIVKATLELFKESYNNNGSHYIFLSQNCIPLYNFGILERLILKFNKSVISCINHNKKERYLQLTNKIKNFLNYNDFVKQQPNMILIKEDVYDLIKNDLTYHFRYMTCPDEHYFINVLLYILKKDIIKQQTHFCNYNLTRTQALEFKNIDINLYNKVKSLGFLFMRKVVN